MGIQLYHIYEVFKYDNWQLKSTYSAVSLIFIYAHITHFFSLWGQPFYLLVYNEWVLLGSWIWTVNWTEFRQHISKFRPTQTLRTMRPSNSCLRMVSNYTCAGQFTWITCQEPGAVSAEMRLRHVTPLWRYISIPNSKNVAKNLNSSLCQNERHSPGFPSNTVRRATIYTHFCSSNLNSCIALPFSVIERVILIQSFTLFYCLYICCPIWS